MPTVKTAKTFFGGLGFTMRVNVNSEGLFTAKLPAWAHDGLGVQKVSGDTLDGVVGEFEHLKHKFSQQLQVKRKVIRYSFSIKDMASQYDRSGRDDMSFVLGKGLVVAVANLVETTHKAADGKILSKTYERCAGESPYPGAYNTGKFGSMSDTHRGHCEEFEWTQEREDWFVTLCGAMDILVEKVRELGENQQILIEAVNNKVLIGYEGAKDE